MAGSASSLPPGTRTSAARGLSRREFLRGVAVGGAALGASRLLVACGPDGSPSSAPREADSPPRRGGRLYVGVAGGGPAETLDAHINDNEPDIARTFQLYEPLAIRGTDYNMEMVLAESIEAEDDGATWVVRLKDGIEFHNGKTVGADDVIYTLQRIRDPDDPKSGAVNLASVDVGGLEKLDERTVRIPLARPDTGFVDEIGQYFMGIVPVDYSPDEPVGTGAFKAQSFSPGDRSVFVRHDNYWRDNEPFVDELVILGFADDAARLSALQAGQIHALSNLPPAQFDVVEADARLSVLEAETGAFQPFTMRVNHQPFDDVRVRQAFRMLVDRQEMLDQALGGHGWVANDLYSPFDPCYANDLPQREHDPDQARSLLAQAGQEDLVVELTTAPIYQGVVDAAQVFAEHASRAGVTVNVNRHDPSHFWTGFLEYPFSQSFWFTRPYLAQTGSSTLPDARFNETHWNDTEWLTLVEEARATLDETRRCELLHEAQRIEHERGGYIIYAFANQLDAYHEDVNGLVPSRAGIPLGNYGFRSVQLDA